MSVLLTILLCLALLLGIYSLFKIRRALAEVSAALMAKRRILLRDDSKVARFVGMDQLIGGVNRLIDDLNVFSEEKTGYSNQVSATLGSIQEAVLIFDSERVIEFYNESARRLFQQNRPVNGMRLEAVIRSTSLLEYLDIYQENKNSPLRQITVERNNQQLWFEVSCAEVAGVSSSTSTLLVLHDITRLKSLEMVRREFVANVSHELRTPLTIIKGFAETLMEDNETLPAESRARFLDKIVNNSERLNVLVEDLLTLSRLESKPDQLEMNVDSLLRLLEDAIDDYGSRLDTARQTINLDFDQRVEDFAFDRFRIGQVIRNLIDNVFRYAPDFTELKLTVRLNAEASLVLCSVQDDGPGIPEKDVAHIFERFYRVDKGRSRERGGTGLGLSIMKHIVQIHGGSVAAESKVGEGTTIRFSLPYQSQ